MSTKRIRCSCGRIYDPVKHRACPDCGTTKLASGSDSTVTREEKSQRQVPEPQPASSPVSLRTLLMGTGAISLFALVVALSRCGSTAPRANPAPSPSPSPASDQTNRDLAPPAYGGSQSADLVALIAGATTGATIKVPPGVYPGGLVLNKPVCLVGVVGQVTIQSEGRECLAVRASGVALENIQFTCNGIGELAAISVADGADLQMDACKVYTNTAVGVSVAGKGNFKTTGSGFTAINGTAVRLANAARGFFTQSTFSSSKIGLWLQENATAEMEACAFDHNGGDKGAIIALSSGKNSLKAADCHFTNNTSGIGALDGAVLAITNSTFTNNGIVPHDGFAMALVNLEGGAQGTLSGDVFEDNEQGVLASNRSTLEINQCSFSGGGVGQRDVFTFCQPVAAQGKGTVVTMRKSKIVNSVQYGANAVAGAKLILEDVEISGTRSAALVVGDRSLGGAEAEVHRSHFTRNAIGLGVFAASAATVDGSEFVDNQDGIIVLDKGSRLQGSKLKVVGNSDAGLFVHGNGEVRMSDADFVRNTRGAIVGVKNKPAERGVLALEDCRFSGQRVFAVGACVQSELVLTRCTFDGTNKLNVFKERGASVQIDAPAPRTSPSVSPKPSSDDQASATPAPTTQPTARPTQSSQRPRRSSKDDAARIIRHLLGSP